VYLFERFPYNYFAVQYGETVHAETKTGTDLNLVERNYAANLLWFRLYFYF